MAESKLVKIKFTAPLWNKKKDDEMELSPDLAKWAIERGRAIKAQ